MTDIGALWDVLNGGYDTLKSFYLITDDFGFTLDIYDEALDRDLLSNQLVYVKHQGLLQMLNDNGGQTWQNS